ncbi:MAG: outer membrane beta-barrel protein [Flavobacteriales bacterium]
MKRMLFVLALGPLALATAAQWQVNPQLGVTYQNITKPPEGVTYSARVGFLLGADARWGNKVYLQPGAFIGRNSTFVEFQDTIAQSGRIVTTNLKLKLMGGYRLIDHYQFDMRLAVGPTFDVSLSQDVKDSDIEFNDGEFNEALWNLDVALGFDMGRFTAEPSVSLGLSRVYNDDVSVQNLDSKYLTYLFTLGVNIGDDDKDAVDKNN